MVRLRYVAFSPSDHYEACFISIIWNRTILQLAVHSLARAFCSWPSCRSSVDWRLIQRVLLGRSSPFFRSMSSFKVLSMMAWFFFFLWRSFWSSLQNSNSSPFLKDSEVAVSGCVPAASISSVMVIDSGFVPVNLYSSLLDILHGHVIPITFLSCLPWKLFSFLWSSFDTTQVPQLQNSTLFTSVSYSLILVISFVFQFFFQIASFFATAITANSFLFWMFFQSPSFVPSFITFPHSLSSSFDPLCMVVYSVFSSSTNRFLLFIISFAFS